MSNYVKQTWKDALVDEKGNVIEAGTLITKERMEHIEEGILRNSVVVSNVNIPLADREEGVMYWLITDQQASVSGDIKVSPTMGIKVV